MKWRIVGIALAGAAAVVALTWVLEHLIDDRPVFAKLCSQVAPGGRLLVSTPSVNTMIARRVCSADVLISSSDVAQTASQMAVEPARLWLVPEIGGVPLTTTPPPI